MPPSQLRRLKTSLREQGVVGPQKSKKQKKQASKSGAFRDSRIQRNAALQGIREQFNPFEVQTPSKSKYEFSTNKTVGGRVGKGVLARPGFTKGLGEENRRKTLLVEMQRRKKVGGIMDRRFGENDPSMTPDEKALQRFVKGKERGKKKGSLFDLEDDEEGAELTHFGESLSFDRPSRLDDFNERDLGDSDEDYAEDFLEEHPTKRQKMSDADSADADLSGEDHHVKPEPFKTKKEVMEEVIAKSKFHKYERQQAKEDDDDLRAELDKGLPDLVALMRGTPRPLPQPPAAQPPNAGMNPDRVALLNGKDRTQADKEYDERLRQMAMDQRAKPSVRTLTAEEKLQQEAHRLKELEEKRLRRMQGEQGDSESDPEEREQKLDSDGNIEPDKEETFGLGPGLLGQSQGNSSAVEDEDDFVIEDDLLASDSDVDASDALSHESEGEQSDNDDDTDFVRGLQSNEDADRIEPENWNDPNDALNAEISTGNLAYTYPCPKTHEDLLIIMKDVAIEGLPTVVQRIRALYHPKLASENRRKIGVFATVLVEHVSYLANQTQHPPFAVLEALIRHVHSLAKSFPEDIGRAFRSHLKAMHEERPTALTTGDLIILTAISTTFPTSDHFHQVVTPAMLCMTRYLGQKIPNSLHDLAMGTYIMTLCLQYQQRSKRYIPEVVNYVLNALWGLAPAKTKSLAGAFPHHTLPESIRLAKDSKASSKGRTLRFWDITPSVDPTDVENDELRIALLHTQLALIQNMAMIWADQSAFCEVFEPIGTPLNFLGGEKCAGFLSTETTKKIQGTSIEVRTQLRKALAARKPLRLHNHRPLAIKTSIPKFEESYNPDKHYDPDRDRAEMSKLKAEHKRERKGALRELRKDANFIARENLKEKKERDSAYEKKYKRLVAEIQGEEGREAKNYEREKRMRKGRK